MTDDGILARRLLPNGKEACVVPQLFNALLTIGKPGDGGYEEAYTFQDTEIAMVHFRYWNMDDEPSGWIRHIPSNRRRPNGDPKQEYIAP